MLRSDNLSWMAFKAELAYARELERFKDARKRGEIKDFTPRDDGSVDVEYWPPVGKIRIRHGLA
jgi:hypothetical protein